MVHRTGGEPAFVGSARAEGDAASFELGAVATPGVFPLRMGGRLERGDLVVETALSSLFVRLRREPTHGLGG